MNIITVFLPLIYEVLGQEEKMFLFLLKMTINYILDESDTDSVFMAI